MGPQGSLVRQAAARALGWPLATWLEGALWLMSGIGLGAAVFISYNSLYFVALRLGHYGEAEARVYPATIDVVLAAAYAGLYLCAYWKGGWWRQAQLTALTVFSAAATLGGNAITGPLQSGELGLPWWSSFIVSAVPGLAIVGVGHITRMMLGLKAELAGRAEQGQPEVASARRLQTGRAVPGLGAGQPVAALPAAGATVRPPRPSGRGQGRASRPAAGEVLAMVRAARERLAGERGREPSDGEVAALVSTGGHRISASRARTYLAQLRAQERAAGWPSSAEEGAA